MHLQTYCTRSITGSSMAAVCHRQLCDHPGATVSRGLHQRRQPICLPTRLLPHHFPRDPQQVCYAARLGAAEAGAPRRRSRPQRDKPPAREPSEGGQQDAVVDASISAARAEAVRLLMRVEHGGAYAGQVTGRMTEQQGSEGLPLEDLDADEEEDLPPLLQPLDARDRRLVKELVAGVTRWRRRLDYVITASSTFQSADRLEPKLLQILRMAVYELLFMEAPAHVLSQHVQLAKVLVRPDAAGFANGLLRSLARAQAAGKVPDPLADMVGDGQRAVVRRLAVGFSHPNWMVARWIKRYGQQATQQLLEHNNRRPGHALRANHAAGVSAAQLLDELQAIEGVSASASAWLPQDFVVVQSGLQAVLQEGLLAKGECTVQDEATGLVVQMVGVQPGQQILDACAAPGGKTMFMASLLQGKGHVTAVDVSESRLATVARSAERLGLEQLVTCHPGDLRDVAKQQQQQQQQQQQKQQQAQASSTQDSSSSSSSSTRHGSQQLVGGPWDVVLLDAPCSGTGVLAKRSDLRWRRTPEHIAELAALQSQLLDAAASLVRPGGLVVYSTCCLEPEENLLQVQAFLERHEDRFSLEAPRAGSVPAEVLVDGVYLMTEPHVHGVDGAFAARLRCRVSA